MTFYLSKLFSMKNSFIKNYEEYEGKVCIDFCTLAEKVISVDKWIAKEDTYMRLANNAVLISLWSALPKFTSITYLLYLLHCI